MLTLFVSLLSTDLHWPRYFPLAWRSGAMVMSTLGGAHRLRMWKPTVVACMLLLAPHCFATDPVEELAYFLATWMHGI